MDDKLVLIAGAGPTGLVLALWLTKLGVKVRIVDRVAEPGTTSRALAVQARTLEFYHQVGFDDVVVDGGVKIQRLNFWVKGQRRAECAPSMTHHRSRRDSLRCKPLRYRRDAEASR